MLEINSVVTRKEARPSEQRITEFWSFPDTDFPRERSAQVSSSVPCSFTGAFISRSVLRVGVSKYFWKIIFFLKWEDSCYKPIRHTDEIHLNNYFHGGQKTFLNQMILVIHFLRWHIHKKKRNKKKLLKNSNTKFLVTRLPITAKEEILLPGKSC